MQTGSTEWVEENREVLTSRAVAYLNVDSAVYGPGFYVSATPQIDPLLIEASKWVIILFSEHLFLNFQIVQIEVLYSWLLLKVRDPDNSSQTLYDSWISSDSSPLVSQQIYI